MPDPAGLRDCARYATAGGAACVFGLCRGAEWRDERAFHPPLPLQFPVLRSGRTGRPKTARRNAYRK